MRCSWRVSQRPCDRVIAAQSPETKTGRGQGATLRRQSRLALAHVMRGSYFPNANMTLTCSSTTSRCAQSETGAAARGDTYSAASGWEIVESAAVA